MVKLFICSFEGRSIDFFSLMVAVFKEVNLDGFYKFKPNNIDELQLTENDNTQNMWRTQNTN